MTMVQYLALNYYVENAVPLVWGSNWLTPIMIAQNEGCGHKLLIVSTGLWILLRTLLL